MEIVDLLTCYECALFIACLELETALSLRCLCRVIRMRCLESVAIPSALRYDGFKYRDILGVLASCKIAFIA
jgi:hypothetical protein